MENKYIDQNWLHIDLHMHSYYSTLQSKKDKDRLRKMEPDELIDILEKQGIQIFSITDHDYFANEYYDKISNYIDDKHKKIVLIDGVEFDAYLENNSDCHIHACVYMEPGVDREKLHEIVNNLYNQDGIYGGKPLLCDILNELYNLNKKVIVIPHGDKSASEKGQKNRAILNRSLFGLLNSNTKKSIYKYSMYKIFNSFEMKPGVLNKPTIQHWAANFYECTQNFNELVNKHSADEINEIIPHLSQKINNKDFELSEFENDVYKRVIEYAKYFSYFTFSDWHNKEEYKPKVNNFIFGSLDHAFDSFELATIDPMSRVILTKDKEISIPNSFLYKVEFKINDQKKTIYLTPGLNAVIGKRGSGKSLFLSVLKSLKDSNSNENAENKYSSLNISNIVAYDRDNNKIEEGELSSATFLSQNDIDAIYRDPELAEDSIANKFPKLEKYDTQKLELISELTAKIRPFLNDYKTVTPFVSCIKDQDDYNYDKYKSIEKYESKLSQKFDTILNTSNEINKDLKEIGLNNQEMSKLISQIKLIKDYYMEILINYNSLIQKHNSGIEKIRELSSNVVQDNIQNREEIKKCLMVIKKNFDQLLIFKKLEYCVDNYDVKSTKLSLKKDGSYLFASYYSVPNDIKDQISEKITDEVKKTGNKSCNKTGTITDLYNILWGNLNLKSNVNIGKSIKAFISSEIFKPKKEFYEIKDESLSSEVDKIEDIKTLEELVEEGRIVNLSKESLGTKSAAYLNMLFDSNDRLLVFDQPEDNIDNNYISNNLVPLIKNKKKTKQLVFVTHNPSVAVYGDAFNYIFVTNENEINYSNFLLENSKDRDDILDILEGGKRSFSNRNMKFGNVIAEEDYSDENNNN